jgi:hypothetical protein
MLRGRQTPTDPFPTRYPARGTLLTLLQKRFGAAPRDEDE